MSPYIVTSKRKERNGGWPVDHPTSREQILSRRAVATLDEVTLHAAERVGYPALRATLGTPRWVREHFCPQRGSVTIGPLPDGTVIEVEPILWREPQRCSSCGEVVPKSLSERIHRCVCGFVEDRDVNAAMNILGAGRALQASTGTVLVA